MISPQKKIRVLIVDDSMVARMVIMEALRANPLFDVVGYAVDTSDARKKISELAPDVVTMDVEMPGQSGIEFLREYIPTHPLPVILVSSLNLKVFDAMAAGAVDFVRKPDATHNKAKFAQSLSDKIVVASLAKVRRNQIKSQTPPPPPIVTPVLRREPKILRKLPFISSKKQMIIAIGASTGGTEATLEILRNMPSDSPGILIVQHMPAGFTKMYAERLNLLCPMEVREAKNGEAIRPGLALVAPAELQSRVVRSGSSYSLSCLDGEKISGHRPSVDCLFQSMADNVKCAMVGVILTGMGGDGARGLLSMKNVGAFTIGQDEQSCVVYGMPKVAHDIGALHVVSPCENIAKIIKRHVAVHG